jgi:predicted N-acyltransferase
MALREEVKVFNSIDEIGKSSVDSIAVDGFFTYGWFKAMEKQSSIPMSPMYIAVLQDEKIVAIAPCYVDLTGQFFKYGPNFTPYFQRILSLGQNLKLFSNPSLLFYSPCCFRSKLLLENDLNEKHILNLIVNKLDAICKEKKFLFSTFLFVSEFDKLLVDNLQNYGYMKFPTITTYYIEPKWSSFEEYLKSLKIKTQKQIKYEMRKFGDSQVVITQKDFGAFSEKFSELSANLASKYSGTKQDSVLTSLFAMLNEYAQDKTKLFIAKKNNNIVGFSMCLRHNDVLDMWIVGFDYDVQTKTDFTYFNLCYYLPTQWAIKEGIRKIYYRWKAEEVKVKRGCVPERNYVFVKCNNRFLSIIINSVLRNRVYSYLMEKYLKQR